MSKKKIILCSIFAVGLIIITITVFINPMHSSKNVYNVDINNSKSYQEEIENSVKIIIKYDSFISDDETDQFSNYFQSIATIPEEYNKLIKLTITMNNNSKYDLSGFISTIYDDYIYMIPESVNLEPTFPIVANSNINVDAYIYINENFKTDNEINDILKKTDFNFLFYIENEEKPLEPYEVTVKGEYLE